MLVMTDFVNKVLLETAIPIHLRFTLGWFYTAMAIE
jgi:hypothetical protein